MVRAQHRGEGGLSLAHPSTKGGGGSRPCTHVHVGENTLPIVINFITVQGGGGDQKRPKNCVRTKSMVPKTIPPWTLNNLVIMVCPQHILQIFLGL